MTDRPAPLVDAEVSLRGLPWMRLDTDRLLNSDLYALSTGPEFKAALSLWCKSWSQEPAGSLPKNERILASLSGANSHWRRVKDMALHGWIECSDGRLYHPVVAEQVNLAWQERQEFRAEIDSQNERKRRERAERSAMFERLKAIDITPPYNIPTGKLRDLIRDHFRDESQTGHGDSHGLDGTGRDGKALLPTIPHADRTLEGPAEALARALVECGFKGASADGTLILEAVSARVTAADVQAIVREKQGKPLVYILRTAIGRKRDEADAAGSGGSASAPALDAATKAEIEARHKRDAEILDAQAVHGLGMIDDAKRDERIAAARARYQAQVEASGRQEARA